MGKGGTGLHISLTQGLSLLSGDATRLIIWSPMSPQEGKRQGATTWEILYRSGLEGTHITLTHIPLATPGCRSLGNVIFLTIQEKK